MDSKHAIYNLEVFIVKTESAFNRFENRGLGSVKQSIIDSAKEQIALYKVGRGRLQSNI